jgi:hypothetical protein
MFNRIPPNVRFFNAGPDDENFTRVPSELAPAVITDGEARLAIGGAMSRLESGAVLDDLKKLDLDFARPGAAESALVL